MARSRAAVAVFAMPFSESIVAIERALEKTRFNRTAAAKLLGISFRALRYRMQRLDIN